MILCFQKAPSPAGPIVKETELLSTDTVIQDAGVEEFFNDMVSQGLLVPVTGNCIVATCVQAWPFLTFEEGQLV